MIAVCLGLVAFALMAVGLVSDTPVRHLIQLGPVVPVLCASVLRVRWAPPAALPLFGFWMFIMGLIWLHLLGIAHFVTGAFSPAEVALTVVIGAAATSGALAVIRGRPRASRVGVGAFVLFATLQICAMSLSLQPAFARI